jgi:hypothetical protein
MLGSGAETCTTKSASLTRSLIWSVSYQQTSRITLAPLTSFVPAALVSICIFWTFLEVGVGFIIACLLPSAKLLDAVSKSPFVHRIMSITSLLTVRSRESVRSKSSSEGKTSEEKMESNEKWSAS